MEILKNIVITVLISIGVFVGAYKYLPLTWLENGQSNSHLFGSTITVINGSDTLSSSRSVINTNFANLNTDKIEATVTTLASLTTASALASIGTITSGIWNGSIITVPYGGTGSSTLSSNQILIGNSTNPLGVVSGYGTSGQFLTSNGTGLAPTWTTSSIDQSVSYTFTGNNTFTKLLALTGNASTSLMSILDTLYIGRTATTTIQGATNGTSAFQGYINVLGSNAATSTFTGNVAILGNATTSSLVVSPGSCVHCTVPTIVSSNSGACSTSGAAVCSATAQCSAGQYVLGGGGKPSIDSTNILFDQSYPSAVDSWTFETINSGSPSAFSVTAYAVCVK